MKTKILLVDDHHLIIDGLYAILQNEPHLEVIAKAHNGEEAIQVLRAQEINLVITDIEMPVMGGVSLIQHIRKCYEEIKVLVVSMHSEQSVFQELMAMGIDGFLLKDAEKQDFLYAINSIIRGQAYFSPKLIKSQLYKAPIDEAAATLTEREQEVLSMIAEGLSNKEIAEKLFLSHKTIDTHRTNLMRKIKVKNVVGLVRYALKHGIVK